MHYDELRRSFRASVQVAKRDIMIALPVEALLLYLMFSTDPRGWQRVLLTVLTSGVLLVLLAAPVRLYPQLRRLEEIRPGADHLSNDA